MFWNKNSKAVVLRHSPKLLNSYIATLLSAAALGSKLNNVTI